jgi:hypothetical protein
MGAAVFHAWSERLAPDVQVRQVLQLARRYLNLRSLVHIAPGWHPLTGAVHTDADDQHNAMC